MLKPDNEIEKASRRKQIRGLYQEGKAQAIIDRPISLHGRPYDISSDKDFVVIKNHHNMPTPSEEHEHKFHIGIPEDRLEDAAVIAFDVSTEHSFSGTKVAKHSDPTNQEQSKKSITIYTTPQTTPAKAMKMLVELEVELKKAEIQPLASGPPSFDARLRASSLDQPLQFTSYRSERGSRDSHYVPAPGEPLAEYYVPPINVNKLDNDNVRSPLHYAAEKGNINAAKQLLTPQPNRANPNERDKAGRTPVHLAAQNGHADSIKQLADKGADIAVTDPSGQTPLHLAAYYGRDSCVNWLLILEAPIDRPDNELKTPLHHAASRGHEKIVAMLLEQPVNVNAKDRLKKGPLDYVPKDTPIAKLLEAKGAQRNFPPPPSSPPISPSSSGSNSSEALLRKSTVEPAPASNATPPRVPRLPSGF
jgi:ankyrin repeat protein